MLCTIPPSYLLVVLDKSISKKQAELHEMHNNALLFAHLLFCIITLTIITYLWVTFLAETSKDLEIILITTVLSFTNSLSRTSLYFSLKTSFVYSNLFSLAKAVTIRCYM